MINRFRITKRQRKFGNIIYFIWIITSFLSVFLSLIFLFRGEIEIFLYCFILGKMGIIFYTMIKLDLKQKLPKLNY